MNIKNPNHLPDYFLSFSGPTKAAITEPSPGYNPFTLKEVCLFDAVELVTRLQREGVPIRHQTRVGTETWNRARIYPQQEGSPIRLTPEQETMLALFTGLD